MRMKRKNFTPTKELESGKQLDTGRNTMNRVSFNNKGVFVFFYIPFTHTALLQCL